MLTPGTSFFKDLAFHESRAFRHSHHLFSNRLFIILENGMSLLWKTVRCSVQGISSVFGKKMLETTQPLTPSHWRFSNHRSSKIKQSIQFNSPILLPCIPGILRLLRHLWGYESTKIIPSFTCTDTFSVTEWQISANESIDPFHNSATNQFSARFMWCWEQQLQLEQWYN